MLVWVDGLRAGERFEGVGDVGVEGLGPVGQVCSALLFFRACQCMK